LNAASPTFFYCSVVPHCQHPAFASNQFLWMMSIACREVTEQLCKTNAL
jgi:hypothetical protein